MKPQSSSAAETLGILVPRDVLEALEAFARDQPGLTTPEAVRTALREWATERGLLPVAPTEYIPLGELNASNDV